jgi:hypothetical protein
LSIGRLGRSTTTEAFMAQPGESIEKYSEGPDIGTAKSTPSKALPAPQSNEQANCLK